MKILISWKYSPRYLIHLIQQVFDWLKHHLNLSFGLMWSYTIILFSSSTSSNAMLEMTFQLIDEGGYYDIIIIIIWTFKPNLITSLAVHSSSFKFSNKKFQHSFLVLFNYTSFINYFLAQSAGAVEYTDCTSAEE